jgi:hypothetical protein
VGDASVSAINSAELMIIAWIALALLARMAGASIFFWVAVLMAAWNVVAMLVIIGDAVTESRNDFHDRVSL